MSTTKEQQLPIKEITWEEAREDVKKANPALADVIDNINPSKDYTLFKVRYPFGSLILDNGVIKLPISNNQFVGIDHPSIPADIKRKLSYSPIPIAVVTSNCLEVYVEPEERLTPLSVLPTGTIFGLWETFDPPNAIFVSRLWNISAGARSIFFLPKISDTSNHKKLQTIYKIKSPVPSSLADHWSIFKEIANHSDSGCNWYCDILFFSNKWIEKQGTDINWLAFRYLLLDTAWKQSGAWRSKIYFDIIWESFSLAIVKRNLKPTQNQINTIKHLIGIGTGIFPGFRAATDNSLAPISQLQKIYVNDYGLKDYAPIIMRPCHLPIEQPNYPVYYSLNFPTQLDYTPKNVRSTIAELREIMRLNETIQRRMQIDNRPVFNLMRTWDYKYFHSEQDILEQINITKVILESDALMAKLLHDFGDKKFAEKSPFLRGCILVSLKQS